MTKLRCTAVTRLPAPSAPTTLRTALFGRLAAEGVERSTLLGL